ncbi:tetratricopeptide repeat protein 9A-like isoform X1 [Tachypleus tridentatus]|uniref:tetratricopeptide repeat protein 9A-like isoform X1 n=1 Tax=Tachypleus tridentatus TaxID=6853 RepID=UPI003FD5B958
MAESLLDMDDKDLGITAPVYSQLSPETKLTEARRYKEEGNALFKEKNLRGAMGKYHRALLFIQGIQVQQNAASLMGLTSTEQPKVDQLPEPAKQEVAKIKVDCYNNLANCLLQQEKKMERVIFYCDKVLDIEPTNVKALYRKGKALYNIKDYDTALQVLQKAQEVDNGNGNNYFIFI